MIYIFNIFTIIFATKNLSGIKIKKKYYYVYPIIIGLLMELVTNIYYSKTGSVPLLLRFTLGLTIIAYISFALYKHVHKLLACISYSILAMIVSIIADNICFGIFHKLNLLSITDTVFNTKYAYVFSIAELLVAYVLSYIIGKIISKVSFLQLFNNYNRFTILLMAIFISTFVLIFYHNMFGGRNIFDHYLTLAFLITYFSFIMIITFVSYRSYVREQSVKQHEVQLQQLTEYTSNLEALYTDMRRFKHDYVNVLSSMTAYLDDNDIEGLRSYFNKNILPFSNQIKSDSFKLGLLSNLYIKELKGILSSKLIFAQQQGIDVYIDIAEVIKAIEIDIIDLCRVVGILVDNAIEGALTSNELSLKIAIVQKKNSVVFACLNSCTDLPPIHKIFEQGFSTKGDNRGYGLFTVKKIVDKYPNCYLDTIIKDNEFTQVLEVFTRV